MFVINVMTAYELKALQYLMQTVLILNVFCGVLVGMRLLIDRTILCQKIKVSYKWILVQVKGLLK